MQCPHPWIHMYFVYYLILHYQLGDNENGSLPSYVPIDGLRTDPFSLSSLDWLPVFGCFNTQLAGPLNLKLNIQRPIRLCATSMTNSPRFFVRGELRSFGYLPAWHQCPFHLHLGFLADGFCLRPVQSILPSWVLRSAARTIAS